MSHNDEKKTEQPNASTQWADWEKYPNTYKEPTHEDWIAEIAALTESRDGWKREYRLINAAHLQAEAKIKELEADATAAKSKWEIQESLRALKYHETSQERIKELEASNRKLREGMERILPIMEKVSRYDSYHQEWEEQDYENAPPEEVILRAVKIANAALGEG